MGSANIPLFTSALPICCDPANPMWMSSHCDWSPMPSSCSTAGPLKPFRAEAGQYIPASHNTACSRCIYVLYLSRGTFGLGCAEQIELYRDRKTIVPGKRVSVRVILGGRRLLK